MTVSVKTSGSALVAWVLCLTLPVGAATSAFVHLHTDAAHESDHHDGREVHRHSVADREHEATPDSIPSDAASVISLSPLAALRVSDAESRPGLPDQPGRPAASTDGVARPVGHASEPPPARHARPASPDRHTSSLRGPPRP